MTEREREQIKFYVTESRFERFTRPKLPGPYETPPPPSRKRRVKKPKKARR